MDLLKAVVCFEKSSKIEGEVVGFVVYRSKTDTFDTVPEKSELKKKIVVLHPDLKKEVVPGVRYEVDMIPMKSNKGFIAVTADKEVIPVVTGSVAEVVVCKGSVYQFKVVMGSKVLNVDLMSKRRSEADIAFITNAISGEQVENKEELLKEVAKTYRNIFNQMNADGVVLVVGGKVVS